MTIAEFILVQLAKYGIFTERAEQVLTAIHAEGGHLAGRWHDPVDWCPAMTRALAVQAVERHMGF